MERAEILSLLSSIKEKIDAAKDMKELIEVKNSELGKKSKFMSEALESLNQLIRIAPVEEKKALGAFINEVKNDVLSHYENKERVLREEQEKASLLAEQIDISLPGENFYKGHKNPLYPIRDEIISFFTDLGYDVYSGPEIENDHYNFELLNTPKDHPARDMQDSFYIDERTLLRTHTSPVQARTMLKHPNTPVKMIAPGKTFRRDDDDLTHSHQFMQIECLVVDEGINLAHLKSTLEKFMHKIFGPKRTIKFVPSYFPFTEPSFEVNVSCAHCHGKGCNMCKGTGFIEVLGAGMVHPNVLRMCGYDEHRFSGFAFGVGVERLAMLRYGIDDIRRFYQNDVRFLKQFQEEYRK